MNINSLVYYQLTGHCLIDINFNGNSVIGDAASLCRTKVGKRVVKSPVGDTESYANEVDDT